VLEHKSNNITETCKDRGKVTREGYRNSPTLFRTVPSPTPYGLPFSKIGGSQSNAKLQSLLSQKRVKLRTANLPRTFKGPSKQKPMKNLGEKGAWAYPRTAHIFEYRLLSQEWVKLRTSNSVRTFVPEQKPIKNFGKSSRGHRAVILAVAQLSCLVYCSIKR